MRRSIQNSCMLARRAATVTDAPVHQLTRTSVYLVWNCGSSLKCSSIPFGDNR